MRVQHKKLFQLQEVEIVGKNIRIVRNLYRNQKAAVQINNNQAARMDIVRGVLQGCVQSPDFFSFYSEVILRAVTENMNDLKVRSIDMTNVRYADDIVLIASSEADLKAFLDKVCNQVQKLDFQ